MDENNIVKGLEGKLLVEEPSTTKIASVDVAGNVCYSLIVGGALDYSAGLNLLGIIVSRISGTVTNAITGGPYGWWREKSFEITGTEEESSRARKTLADLLAFNTFQVPLYADMVAIGSYVSEGRVDMEKVENGAKYLATISPFIGPTMGYFIDAFRRVFGVKTAAQGAYRKEEVFRDGNQCFRS